MLYPWCTPTAANAIISLLLKIPTKAETFSLKSALFSVYLDTMKDKALMEEEQKKAENNFVEQLQLPVANSTCLFG